MIPTYSKELMKHFKNPKFVKDVKDSNGVGEVGNVACGDIMHLEIKVGDNKIEDIGFKTFGCLHPNEKVNLENRWIEIFKLSKEDRVLNRFGKKTKINTIYKGNFNGELYHIIPFVSKFNGFMVTPTHPILCIKRKFLKKTRRSSNKCDWLRLDEKELILSKPYYVEAELIEKGDYLIFPKLKKINDNKRFTNDLMRLIGYYLSEGYITSKGNTLNFSFNKNELEYIEEVKSLIIKIIGKKGNYRIRKNVCEIYVCSRKWCKFFEEHCGKLAKGKTLSNEIIFLPFKKQWEMIKTYINGDGNIYKRREKDSVTYRVDTVSESLAIQLQKLLARGNIFASIKRYDKLSTIIEGRKLLPFTIFNISFKIDKKHKFVKGRKDYFLVPIKKIQKEKFKGKVYNLEVHGDEHSYLVKGFVVHNCAAAIASSDVVCELAQGKTIEEAEKIKKDDIVEKLKGMPQIKVHCSVLGIEALKKAIKDYRSKKGK